jgi:IS30 family transposase
MSEKLDFDKLSPRLKRLIAYTFENTFDPDMPDEQAKVGGIGICPEDLYYVLNMAAKAEMADQANETVKEEANAAK